MSLSMLPRTMLESLVMRTPGRDYEKECGYPTIISKEAYYRAYLRNGLCQRVVNLMPDECAQIVPEINEKDSDATETPWEGQVKEHAEKVNLWHYLQEADKQAGIGRFGVLLIGLSDGQKLDKPVRKGEGLEVMYLRVFPERYAQIVEYEKDVTNPRYGKPVRYQLTVTDCSEDSPSVGDSLPSYTDVLTVHWSRVLHLSDSGEVFSSPRLESVWNWAQVDLSKLVGGANEMFWRGAFPGFFFEVDNTVDLSDQAVKDGIKDSAFQYFNTLTRAMHMQGVKIHQLTPSIADPTSQFNMLLQLIAISKDCPLPILTGAQSGGLNTDNGLRGKDEWSIRKQTRRERYLIPKVIRAYIDMMMDYGVLPTAEYTAVYPDPHTLTDAEKATNAFTWIQAIAKYIADGCDVLLSPMSFLVEICGMDQERATRIMDALAEYAKEMAAREEEAQAEQEALMAEQQEQLPAEGEEGTEAVPEAPEAAAGGEPPAVPPAAPAPPTKKFMVTTNAEALYGHCPKCGAAGVTRERRKNGNDVCGNGCKYPSKDAVIPKMK